ncbi:hypothetical protein VFPPC_06266 [Pochonia chlamydosporia 170]|uniref:Uncharacterized protein n=1 Tax=Pochonia chlamydosporia 170 TaxID=1380566 RepID=A0A179FHJ6_METCM|nr:hypothetical protein VFPPC_06266 [Pochonia chlamydosporia 170]OAQ65095.1 hypothetical protein VFPPC_06266 [Pochonia chlamydosporia 170]
MASMHLISRIPEHAASYKKTRYDHYTFALTHYNAALRDIASILSHGVPHHTYRDVFLICSILFTSIAVLSGATDEIMLHARSALHLFYQWKFWEDGGTRRDTQPGPLLTNKSAFVRLMSRLEAQIMWRGCIRDWNDPAQVRLPSSRPFQSTMDAYVEMQTLISAMTEFHRLALQNSDAKHEIRPIQDSYGLHAQAVTMWRAKYRELRRSQQPNEHELIPDFVVRIWLTWFEKALGLCAEKDWCCQIALNPIYEEVLKLAEKTADSTTDGMSLQNPILGGFSYGPSVCEPLQMVAIHRESAQSHRAIALLRRLGRNEGLWDTGFMASFAEARTMVEESLDESLATSKKRPCGFGQLGCTCGRVVDLSIEFLETKAARVRLRALDEALGHSSEHIRDISW